MAYSKAQLKKMDLKDLKEEAKSLGIKGIRSMDRDELIESLLEKYKENKKRVSPARKSRSPKRSRSPARKSRSPVKKSRSPAKKRASPRRSPVKKSRSPAKKRASPRRSPVKKSRSPAKKRASPKRSRTPVKKVIKRTPVKSRSPSKRKSVSPRRSRSPVEKKFTEKELSLMTMTSLKALAKELGIVGYSSYKSDGKSELIKKILKAARKADKELEKVVEKEVKRMRRTPTRAAKSPVVPKGGMTRMELELMNITKLKEIAKDLKVPRYSTYKSDGKDELIEKILEAQAILGGKEPAKISKRSPKRSPAKAVKSKFTTMVLPELKEIAKKYGIKNITKYKKADLIAEIEKIEKSRKEEVSEEEPESEEEVSEEEPESEEEEESEEERLLREEAERKAARKAKKEAEKISKKEAEKEAEKATKKATKKIVVEEEVPVKGFEEVIAEEAEEIIKKCSLDDNECSDEEVCAADLGMCVKGYPESFKDSITYKGKVFAGSKIAIDALRKKIEEIEGEEEEEEEEEIIIPEEEGEEEEEAEEEGEGISQGEVEDILEEIMEEEPEEDLAKLTEVQKRVLQCLGLLA